MFNKLAVSAQLDFEEIKQIIPQRFPFLMLDRVIALEPGICAVGLKNLTGNEFFYQGHFPKKAVTPGVMIGEAIAQTGIVFFHTSQNSTPRDVTYLLAGLKLRFLEPVWPGDQLRIKVTPIKMTANAAILRAEVTVEDRIVSRGEFTLAAKETSAL